MHSNSSRECSSLDYGHQQCNIDLAVASVFPHPPCWIELSGTKMRSPVVTWHFDRAIQIPFLGQSGPTSNARKIGNFDPRGLKLRNCVFQRVNFITTEEKDMLHGHFK